MRRRRRILARLLILVAILGVLLIAAAVWLRQALPRIAAQEIGRLINGRVETGAFHLHRNGSVVVTGLVIRPKEGPGPYDDTILRAESVYAKFDRRSLLTLSPRVTAIGIQNFFLDVQLDLNTGRWNIGSLRLNTPRGGRSGNVPVIGLTGGKLRYCKISGLDQEVVMSVPIEARFEPDATGNPGYSFEIKTSKLSGGYGESRLGGRWRPCTGPAEPGELTLAGGLSSTDIPSLERAWAIDIMAGALQYGADGSYSLEMSMKNLHGKQAPEMDMLRFVVPAAADEAGPLQRLQQFFAEYQPTGTVGSVTVRARGNIKRLNDSEVEGKAVCTNISVCDKDFPYRLDHLAGEIEFTQSSLRVNRLVGRHGPVAVHIDAWAKGFGDDRQYQYRITSDNMRVDNTLYAALTPEQKQVWDAFQPSGRIAVDYRLTRTSSTNERLYLSVDLNDVSAAFREFPYPLSGLTGNLFFNHESVLINDVVAKAAGGEIRINGKATQRPGDAPSYYLSIQAKDIPLDATLREALPAQHRDLFRQFDANGLADLRARVFSTEDANGVASSLSSRPPAAVATALGSPSPAADRVGASGAAVSVAGSDKIDPAEPQRAQHVSFLADVSCKKASVKLALPCWEPPGPAAEGTSSVASDPVPGRGVPAPATAAGQPLIISDIAAEATITPDSMNIRQFSGRHGPSPVAMTGGLLFGEGGRLKQCHLEVAAGQVPLDGTTLGLLPPFLATQAAALHAEGEANVIVNLKKAGDNELPEYTVHVECLGDRINHERFAYPLEDVRGTLTFGKDSLVLKNVTARPQEGPTADSGMRQTVETNPQSTSRHPPSTKSPLIRIDGSATLARGSFATGSCTVRATDLPFSENLARVLPRSLAGLYRELMPQGVFDLDLTTVKVSRAATDETCVEFGGTANLKGCDLMLTGAPTNVAGALDLGGSYGTRNGLTRGEARLVAGQLVVKGKAITHANIDALYDPNTRQWTAENLVGDCYGGKVLGRLEIDMPKDGRQKAEGPESPSSGLGYQLRVALDDVDVQRFLAAGAGTDREAPRIEDRELLSSVLTSSTSASGGTMDAALSLTGRMGDRRGDRSSAGPQGPGLSRRGVCRIDIANMQVGKVSLLGNVLSVLRLSEPSDYTFERMLIDSYIRADKLLISTLDLSGKNTAFTGSGTMDLLTDEIDLTLVARGQRVAAAGPSVFQSLTEGLGGAVVRIKVTGKAGSPLIQTKALPVIEDSLRLLGAPEEEKKGRK